MDHAPQTQSYYIDPRSYAPSKPYETPKLLDPFSGDDPPQNKGAGKTNEKGMKKGRKDHPKGRKGGLTKTGAATGATGAQPRSNRDDRRGTRPSAATEVLASPCAAAVGWRCC